MRFLRTSVGERENRKGELKAASHGAAARLNAAGRARRIHRCMHPPARRSLAQSFTVYRSPSEYALICFCVSSLTAFALPCAPV